MSAAAKMIRQQGRVSLYLTDDTLPPHIELIRRQTVASLIDGETISLARALCSSSFDQTWDQRAQGGRGAIVPTVPYHGRIYRGASDWRAASLLCSHRDRLCEIAQIWNFLVLNVRYVADPRRRDTYSTLQATLETGAGDCDDFTVGFGALLGAIGYPVRARVISVDGSAWDHIYPLVGVKGRWIPLDATEHGKSLGWEFSHAAKRVDFPLV